MNGPLSRPQSRGYDRREMAATNRARYLAPIALVATVVAGYVVIRDALIAKSAKPRSQLVLPVTTRHDKFATARFYVVRSGDSLSAISVKTGVSVSMLEELNPNVDPNLLQTGQRLRLRR
jgi:LysM repeat protein